MLTIPFEKSDGSYLMKDALVLPDDHAFTEDELEAMKQGRFDDWCLAINPSPIEYKRDAEGNTILDENGNPMLLGA